MLYFFIKINFKKSTLTTEKVYKFIFKAKKKYK